eukprot:1149429-Pelagomonas_calceolata.AAC.2
MASFNSASFPDSLALAKVRRVPRPYVAWMKKLPRVEIIPASLKLRDACFALDLCAIYPDPSIAVVFPCHDLRILPHRFFLSGIGLQKLSRSNAQDQI